MEVTPDSVINEALLRLRLTARLVTKHDIVIPALLDLQTGQVEGA